MKRAHIIAIDGPAASGKSTLGKQLSEHLGYLHVDTGVMYRAVAWAALQRGIALDDEAAITKLAEALQIDVRLPTAMDGRAADIYVDQQDVTWQIRSPEVDATVSIAAAYPGVRQALTEKQREIGLRGRVVMVGRDIGTVVLPEADLKIYLDASLEERARRRFLEELDRGEGTSLEEVLTSMRKRDQIDITRSIAPLRPAVDAVILNTDGMDADAVFRAVKDLMERKVG